MKLNFDLVESGERVEFNLKDTKVVNTGGGVSENRVRQIVDEATAELKAQADEISEVANAKSAVFVDGQKVDEFNADEKFDKTGGAISGDVSIRGNLSVSGTTTTTDTQTLRVLDNVVVANANGIPLVELSGFAIKTNADQSYGIMYDNVGDGVKIGLGGFTDEGEFVYNEGEAQFLATRADTITDGHIPKWDNEKKQFVDSGVGYDEYVKFTDYATPSKAGVVKVMAWGNYGIYMVGDGSQIAVYKADNSDIDAKTSIFRPIVPENQDYAWKVSATTNTETWTDEDKAKACETIGAVAQSMPKAGVRLYGSNNVKQSYYDLKYTGLMLFKDNNISTVPFSDFPDQFTLTDEQKAKLRAWLGIE